MLSNLTIECLALVLTNACVLLLVIVEVDKVDASSKGKLLPLRVMSSEASPEDPLKLKSGIILLIKVKTSPSLSSRSPDSIYAVIADPSSS